MFAAFQLDAGRCFAAVRSPAGYLVETLVDEVAKIQHRPLTPTTTTD